VPDRKSVAYRSLNTRCLPPIFHHLHTINHQVGPQCLFSEVVTFTASLYCLAVTVLPFSDTKIVHFARSLSYYAHERLNIAKTCDGRNINAVLVCLFLHSSKTDSTSSADGYLTRWWAAFIKILYTLQQLCINNSLLWTVPFPKNPPGHVSEIGWVMGNRAWVRVVASQPTRGPWLRESVLSSLPGSGAPRPKMTLVGLHRSCEVQKF